MSRFEIAEVCVGAIGLFLTFVGLILIIIGWIIPYKQKVELEEQRQISEQNFQKTKWEKELIDEQISKFYGPISALIEEQNVIRLRVFYMIGRNCIFDSKHPNLASLPDNERKIWIHFIDTYKLPIGRQIVEIIRNNKHLIYKSEIPDSFKVFMDYTLGWELLDNQKKNNVPNYYEYSYVYNYPVEFNNYINNTLKELLRRQADLTGILKIYKKNYN